MQLNISGMSPEQKVKIKTIVQLGQMFGGDSSFNNYLMSELANVYNPQPEDTSDMDKAILNVLDPSDPESQVIFNNILAKYGYGTPNPTMLGSEGGDYAQNFRNKYLGMAETAPTQDEFNIYNRMSQFSPEEISQYEAPISFSERLGRMFGVASDPSAGPAAFRGWGALLNGEAIRRQRLGLE